MTKKQRLHIGMINSYNLLTEIATLSEILESGVAIFSHVPDDIPTLNELEKILFYFQEIEMFEHCTHIVKYMEINYDEDGNLRGEDCDCDYPSIVKYEKNMKCGACFKRLRKV